MTIMTTMAIIPLMIMMSLMMLGFPSLSFIAFMHAYGFAGFVFVLTICDRKVFSYREDCTNVFLLFRVIFL